MRKMGTPAPAPVPAPGAAEDGGALRTQPQDQALSVVYVCCGEELRNEPMR